MRRPTVVLPFPFRVALLTVLSCLVSGTPLLAQYGIVSITPSSGSFPVGSQYVTVSYCAVSGGYPYSDSHSMTFNGNDVTGDFSLIGYYDPSCTWYQEYGGYVTIASGSNSFFASFAMVWWDLADQFWEVGGTNNASYTGYVPDQTLPTITLVAPSGPITAEYPTITLEWCDNVSLNASSRYIYINSNLVTSAFSYTTLSGSGCGAARAQSTTTSVAIPWGNSLVQAYICDDSANCKVEYDTIQRGTQGAPIVALRNQNGDNIDRGLCLSIQAGSGAGTACGDLYLTHSTLTYQTLGRDRKMTLIYSSAASAPRPAVAAFISEAASTLSPSTLYAELRINASVRASASYDNLVANGTRQIVLAYNANNDTTGLYDFVLEARNQYNGGGVFGASVSGRLIVVNRRTSEFGAGWWLAGVEQLVKAPANRLLWVSGDASAAVYDSISPGTWRRVAGSFLDEVYRTVWGYRRVLRHGVEVHFDLNGRHIRTQNRFGHQTFFTWGTPPGSGAVRLLTVRVPPAITDTSKITYRFTWDPYQYLDYITDPAGRVTNVSVAGLACGGVNTLCAVWDPDNVSQSFGYDADLRLTARYNRRSSYTAYEYANGMRITKVSVPTSANAAGHTTIRSWDEQGLAIGMTSGTRPAADTAASYTRVDGPLTVGDSSRFWVDRWGSPVRIIGPVNDTTRLVRDPVRGWVSALRNPVGDSVTTFYSSRGNDSILTRHTHDGTGVTIAATARILYGDPAVPDEPTEVRAPTDTIRYQYLLIGLPHTVIAQGGARTLYTYDTVTASPYRGLMKSVSQPGTRIVDTVTWNRNQLVTSVATYAYDLLGNDTSVTAPSGLRTRYERDAATRIWATEDPLQHRTTFGFDAMGRRAQVTEPGNTVTRYFYSATGMIDSILDPRNVRRRVIYDVGDRPVWLTDETGAQEERFFGHAGLLDSVRTRAAQTIRFRYDNAGRQTAVVFPARTMSFPGQPSQNATIPGDSISRTYDAAGRLYMVRKNDNSQVVFSYNREGTVRTERQLVYSGTSPIHDYTVTYWYDAGDRRTQFFNGTDTLRYQYGANGQLSQLTVKWMTGGLAPDTFRFFWDSLNRRDSLVLAAPGAHVSWGYDIDGQLRMICSRHPGNNYDTDHLEHSLRYPSYTADGLPRQVRRNAGGSQSGPACSTSLSALVEYADYEYDARHQMTRDYSNRYSYDASGNRVARRWSSDNVLRDSLEYDPVMNRLARRRGDGNGGTGLVMTYTYDGPGALYQEQPAWGGGTWRLYYYNAIGQLRGHKAGNGSWLGSPTDCIYDGLARRVNPCAGGGGWPGYDGANVIRSQGGFATPLWRFVHGPGTDDPLVAVYYLGSGSYEKYYYLTDGDGRQLAFTNAGGDTTAITWLRYHQHGGNQAGAIARSNTFEHTRAEATTAPELSYYRARYYDQKTGRWIQEDPVGNIGGSNLYGYADNSPAALTDPHGEFIFALIGFVAIAGAEIASGATILAAIGTAAATMGAAALGSAASAGVESLIAGGSFWDAFDRNLDWAGATLAVGVGAAAVFGGGYAGAGTNGLIQGYVQSNKPIGIGGGLTIGSGAIISGEIGPELLAHELGHTIQFIALSGFGNPWLPYLGLGVLGTTKLGRWWENLATILGNGGFH